MSTGATGSAAANKESLPPQTSTALAASEYPISTDCLINSNNNPDFESSTDFDSASTASAIRHNSIHRWSLSTRSLAHYVRLEQIGEGTYGQVYKALCLSGVGAAEPTKGGAPYASPTDAAASPVYGRGTPANVHTAAPKIVALKKIRIHHPGYYGLPPTVLREIKILKKLQHPNLVKMFEVVSSKGVEEIEKEFWEDEREDERRKRGKADKLQEKDKLSSAKKSNLKDVVDENKSNNTTPLPLLNSDDDPDSLLLKNNKDSANNSSSAAANKNANNKDTSASKSKKKKKPEMDALTTAREAYKGSLFLVLEYISHDLTGLLDMAYKFTAVQIKSITKQLLGVLDFMHERGYVHRDIKSSNILIDGNYRVKLADFGLARCLKERDNHLDYYFTDKNSSTNDGEFTNKVITLWYRPPELLLGATKYGPAVDIWSAGCILAEIILGRPIFTGKTEMDQLKLIFDLIGTPTERSWEGLKDLKLIRTKEVTIDMEKHRRPKLREKYGSKIQPQSALNLLDKLLELDPNKRFSASQALGHFYFLSAPVAPADPSELGTIHLGGDGSGNYHEFQTKKRRREAKAVAKKVEEEARMRGEDEKEAFDKAYRDHLKKGAEQEQQEEVLKREKEAQQQQYQDQPPPQEHYPNQPQENPHDRRPFPHQQQYHHQDQRHPYPQQHHRHQDHRQPNYPFQHRHPKPEDDRRFQQHHRHPNNNDNEYCNPNHPHRDDWNRPPFNPRDNNMHPPNRPPPNNNFNLGRVNASDMGKNVYDGRRDRMGDRVGNAQPPHHQRPTFNEYNQYGGPNDNNSYAGGPSSMLNDRPGESNSRNKYDRSEVNSAGPSSRHDEQDNSKQLKRQNIKVGDSIDQHGDHVEGRSRQDEISDLKDPHGDEKERHYNKERDHKERSKDRERHREHRNRERSKDADKRRSRERNRSDKDKDKDNEPGGRERHRNHHTHHHHRHRSTSRDLHHSSSDRKRKSSIGSIKEDAYARSNGKDSRSPIHERTNESHDPLLKLDADAGAARSLSPANGTSQNTHDIETTEGPNSPKTQAGADPKERTISPSARDKMNDGLSRDEGRENVDRDDNHRSREDRHHRDEKKRDRESSQDKDRRHRDRDGDRSRDRHRDRSSKRSRHDDHKRSSREDGRERKGSRDGRERDRHSSSRTRERPEWNERDADSRGEKPEGHGDRQASRDTRGPPSMPLPGRQYDRFGNPIFSRGPARDGGQDRGTDDAIHRGRDEQDNWDRRGLPSRDGSRGRDGRNGDRRGAPPPGVRDGPFFLPHGTHPEQLRRREDNDRERDRRR